MVLEEAKILNKEIIITDTAAREAVKKYKNSMILENTEFGIFNGLEKVIKEGRKESEKTEGDYDNSDILEKIIEILDKNS